MTVLLALDEQLGAESQLSRTVNIAGRRHDHQPSVIKFVTHGPRWKFIGQYGDVRNRPKARPGRRG